VAAFWVLGAWFWVRFEVRGSAFAATGRKNREP